MTRHCYSSCKNISTHNNRMASLFYTSKAAMAQVTIYAMAAKEALGYKPEILSLYFLEAGEKITTTRTDKDLEKEKVRIAETIDKIKTGHFEANPTMQCNWCPYRDICPFAYKG